MRYNDLIKERKMIDAGMALMKATKWPIEAEYGPQENA